MNIKKILTLTTIGALFIALSACQTTRRTLNFETSAQLELKAFSNTNPDDDNRPSPVVIRVFTLGDARQFSREDFLNLYENAEDRLGKDLIDTIVLKELAPGETRIEILELSPEIKYIGLLAEFVQYEDADAIMVLPIIDHKKNSYEVNIIGNTLTTDEDFVPIEKKNTHKSKTSKSSGSSSSSDFDYSETREQIHGLKSDKDLFDSEFSK